MSKFAVALPSGEGFGWGVAGRYIANGLAEKIGADVYAMGSGPQHIVADVCLQAIAGPSWGYTSNHRGDVMIGYGFIEDTHAAMGNAVDRSRLWDCVLAGSSWMASMVRAGAVVVQGVDPSRYRLSEIKPNPDYFTIGSFGKFEFRKGQDVLVKALAAFCKGKKNIRLIHGWKNLWPPLVSDFDKAPKVVEFPKVELLSFVRSPDQIRDQEWVKFTNALFGMNGVKDLIHWPVSGDLAWVYPMCDVAVFPNRCEAGTNLCLHEAMACGVPCIAQTGTGQDDIIVDTNYYYGLRNNDFYDEDQYYMWSKPCVREVIDSLEMAYDAWGEGALQAERPHWAAIGAKYTWSRTVDQIAEIMLSYS